MLAALLDALEVELLAAPSQAGMQRLSRDRCDHLEDLFKHGDIAGLEQLLLSIPTDHEQRRNPVGQVSRFLDMRELPEERLRYPACFDVGIGRECF